MLIPSSLQQIESDLLTEKKIELWIKRDDLIHPIISGNKWRKLKWNILKAKENKKRGLLTFGGAYSNHIAATAFACKENDIESIGVIRGDEWQVLNSTLQKAKDNGMQLRFISREEYKQKTETNFLLNLQQQFKGYQIVPEGGANYYGAMGCMEIAREVGFLPDYYACSAGTGTTATGLLMATQAHQKVLTFSALKGGSFLKNDIEKMVNHITNNNEFTMDTMKGLELIDNYHFGGYAKITPELIAFVNSFYHTFKIPLDLIYTSKMFYGLFDQIKQGFFRPNTKIVALHTGGLQGNLGFEQQLKKMNLTLQF